MSRDTPEARDRDAALRRVLVAQADRPRPSRMPWPALVGTVAVVALLGGVAIGATAFRGAADAQPGATDEPDVFFGTPQFVYDDATILGEPVRFRSTEPQTRDLGEPPSGATALAAMIWCYSAGTYSVSALDGMPSLYQPITCDDDARVTEGVAGGYIPFPTEGATRVEVSATPGGDYAVWLAWVAKPADPEPSAEQAAALADGEVTREEYVAGFDRFAACMAEAGYEIGGGRDLEIILYSLSSEAVSSGADHRCYLAEFAQLDIEWQGAHPQRSHEQLTALMDGVVTRAEYLDAFDRYAQCAAGVGGTVLVADRERDVLEYTVETGAPSSEVSRCYRFEFFDVDLAWRSSQDR